MRLTAGILIIGSLYWDDGGGRDRWRKWRLDLSRQWHVQAPIRYGRKSENRNCTYTMVFADASNGKLGQGIVIPCLNAIRSFHDLVTEAEWLWAAETNHVPARKDGDPPPQISASWGRVALCLPGATSIPAPFLEEWQKFSGGHDDDLLIDSSGLLRIDWPAITSTNAALPIDVLLATSNRPSDSNPSAQAVANAWNAHGFRDYFDNNQQAGILTFQDVEIKHYLK
jgi:hypothetical protein